MWDTSLSAISILCYMFPKDCSILETWSESVKTDSPRAAERVGLCSTSTCMHDALGSILSGAKNKPKETNNSKNKEQQQNALLNESQFIS